MDRETSKKVLVISAASLLFAMIIAYLIIPSNLPVNSGFKDGASALAFISAAAVGIERTIEAFWTIMGSFVGTYWPLNAVNKQVDALSGELDTVLTPFQAKLTAELQVVEADVTKAQEVRDRAAEGIKEIQQITNKFNELKSLAPDNQRIQLLTATVAQQTSYLTAKYKDLAPHLESAENIAKITVNGVQDFVATFKDNPGRRFISIFLGAIFGVLIAGGFGLDLFQAIMQQTPAHPNGQILLTGLVMGLGSNPTHEVIRAVQEYKKGQKGDNTSKPDLPTTPQIVQLVQPVQPVQPAQPVQPVQLVQPVQPVQPAQPVQPVQPVQPAPPAV